jgi:cytochrome b561
MLTLRSTPTRHGPVAQAFHWLTVALVLAAYILSEGGPETRVYSPAGEGARRIHETLGMVVFGVVLLRLLWRLVDTRPPLHFGPAWMTGAARLAHFLLYALLLAIPVTAIFGTWYEGHPLTLLGLDLAPRVGEAHDFGQLVIKVHTTLGNVILWVAGLHAAAALVHHFYLRDAVLRSMLPGHDDRAPS